MLPVFRCATHTEVSTRTILIACRPSPRDCLYFFFCSPEVCEPFATFSRYKCFEPQPDKESFFLNAGQLCCLVKQLVFYVESGSHTFLLLQYSYVLVCINCMHLSSRI